MKKRHVPSSVFIFPEVVTPIFISGLAYPVTITDQHMRIGCEQHLIEDWREFDDARINEMDGRKALRFWQAHRDWLLSACDAHIGKVQEVNHG